MSKPTRTQAERDALAARATTSPAVGLALQLGRAIAARRSRYVGADAAGDRPCVATDGVSEGDLARYAAAGAEVLGHKLGLAPAQEAA